MIASHLRSAAVRRTASAREPGLNPFLVLLVLLAVATSLFFWRLGNRDLWSSHEARAAMDAQSLLAPGSDGLPRLHDGRLEVQKPPLYYWLVAGVAWLRGGEIDGLEVRLPAALSAAGVLLVVGLGLAEGFGRPLAGLLAALILATGVHFPWLARIGRIDMPLTFAVTAAGMAFALALQDTSRARSKRPSPQPLTSRAWMLPLAYLFCSLGVLLKGPIGLVLPAAIVAATLLAEMRWPAVWEWCAWRELIGELRLLPGLLLVGLVTVPYFLWLDHASQGEFTREFFWRHNVERGLGGATLRSHPPWHYAGYLLLYLLPWSLLLPLAWPRLWRDDPVARLGLAWLVGTFAVLSAAHFKRADYLLPAYPGAAIFLGCCLERLLTGRWGRPVLAGVMATSGLMVAGWVLWVGWGLPGEESYRDYRSFAAAVRRHAPAPRPVIFFRAEAHALAFRVGRPLRQVVEWRELSECLGRPGTSWVVLHPREADEAKERLRGVELSEVASNLNDSGRHERPLVLLRASPRERHACLPQAAPRLP
jgi:4-amino-4-deoxy-L-arabinose transferase-like glycosyltransferase